MGRAWGRGRGGRFRLPNGWAPGSWYLGAAWSRGGGSRRQGHRPFRQEAAGCWILPSWVSPSLAPQLAVGSPRCWRPLALFFRDPGARRRHDSSPERTEPICRGKAAAGACLAVALNSLLDSSLGPAGWPPFSLRRFGLEMLSLPSSSLAPSAPLLLADLLQPVFGWSIFQLVKPDHSRVEMGGLGSCPRITMTLGKL